MSTTKLFHVTLRLLISLLIAASLLSACSTGDTSTPEATATTAPPAAAEPTESIPEITAEPATSDLPEVTLDTGNIAANFQIEVVAAQTNSSDAPYWEVLPEYLLVTLQGYPISDHLMMPQIFIYPGSELGAVNEGAGQIAASLQTLIQSPQEIANMPFLPLFNAAQVMHVHMEVV